MFKVRTNLKYNIKNDTIKLNKCNIFAIKSEVGEEVKWQNQ